MSTWKTAGNPLITAPEADGNSRLPADAQADLHAAARLGFTTALKLQRAANRLVSQVRQRQLFHADSAVCNHDGIVMQIAFQLRDEIRRLDNIACDTPDQLIARSKLKIAALSGIGAITQAALAEAAKITVNTAKTAIESQKLLMLAEKLNRTNEDDITDAELAEDA